MGSHTPIMRAPRKRDKIVSENRRWSYNAPNVKPIFLSHISVILEITGQKMPVYSDDHARIDRLGSTPKIQILKIER